MTTLANDYRPRTFGEVVGQDSEIRLLKAMLKKGWKPSAILLTGPFGTGKTTLARLIARAKLCDNPQYGADQLQPTEDRGLPYEPCGECDSCKAIDRDNHPNYTEIDAATNGAVADVRAMKDHMAYRTGSKISIVCYDESHGLSSQAQNALLQTLEEGSNNILFLFATTDAPKMLPTIRSRCVEVQLKLLKREDIKARLLAVAQIEGIDLEDKAAGVMATYVRGHVRDALILLEQLSNMDRHVTEEAVRTYLRLDRNDEIYQLLLTKDKKVATEALENLLCNHAPSDLAESIGEVLLNAYKLKLGYTDFVQTDQAWLRRVLDARGDAVLDQAEAVLCLPTDFSSINYGIASLAKILIEEQTTTRSGSSRGLTPGGGIPAQIQSFRKPGS